ncbi:MULTISPECIES: VOC family protein [Aeromonas]|uniref:VOC family protein n=1 Tax=Aeromonas TaxID=642 RepID=UPI001C2405A3|nr:MULTISPECIES: VOC family protein [Aeromonas]QWZ81989.1 VOC family protein [Aeromonas sp. FDAARGOS 1414]QXB03490.1 VOC family protein [Aeromonas sp. FDAARGOS 1416]HDN9000271.1 VOC family protein [Aeromonas veronii AMC24]
MKAHEKLNYVEFAARDLAATKAFFQAVFGWQFVGYGPDYSADIETTQAKVSQHGGTINRPLFDFPGGRRFHFVEPSGNEFAVWSVQAK